VGLPEVDSAGELALLEEQAVRMGMRRTPPRRNQAMNKAWFL